MAKVLGPLTKTGIKLKLQVKNQPIHLAGIPVGNLIKAKSTKNTNLNRQYSFINFWHFLASDAKVGGWVFLNL